MLAALGLLLAFSAPPVSLDVPPVRGAMNWTRDARFGSDPMDCGGAPLCGVVALETGLGDGNYNHSAPTVHGLWPETNPYGNSKCIHPGDSSNPTKVYSCYQGDSPSDQLSFEIHEWGKHGSCAGVSDCDDFFGQICSLVAAPLEVMTAARKKGGKLRAIADAVTKAGYTVFATDTANSQVQVATCAGADGKWQFADPSQFGTVCAS
jgi:hypothetical protein